MRVEKHIPAKEMTHADGLFLLRKKAVPSILLLCAWNLVSGQTRYSIPEELEHGALVGKIAKDLELNLEELSARRFRIVSQAPMQYFDINLQNGFLFVNKRIDREALCGQSLTCLLPLELEIENPVEQYRAEVEILDINDNSPNFSNREIRLEIAESATPGTRFTLQAAQDPDVGNNSIRIYRLTSNEHFVLHVQTLGKWKIPELVVKQSLDREKQSSHRLLLTAVDGGIPERSGTAQLTIIVSDTNDNAPVFQQSLYTASLMEDATPGTLVIKLNATDLDDGSNGDIVYSLGSYNEERIPEVFRINPKSGEIRVKEILDFEEKSVYEIHVEAKDRGAQSLSAHCIVRVDIKDVNDNAPELILKSVSTTISEDAPTGTLVALVSVTDRDSNENERTDCYISPHVPFDLKPTFRNSYRLIISGLLDRESASEYAVTVTCKDQGSPPLSTNKTIVVHISDINDNAPRFTQSSYTVYVTENNSPGNSIGSVTAFDPDTEHNSQLSYTILESNVQGDPVSSYVSINSENGIIYSKRSFDYEQLKSFKIRVQAQDAGFPLLSGNVTVNVIILDQNDNAPVMISPRLADYNKTTVPRSADPGFLVTKIIASDADSGQNARISYQLVQATDPGLFTVSRSSGEIRSFRRFKDGDATTQRIVIQVKDNGHPPLSTTTTVTLTIIEQSAEIRSEVGDLHSDLQHSSDLAFYIIISLGIISLLLLVIIIGLVIAICPTDRHFGHTGRCFLANSCCVREMDSKPRMHNSHVNLQIVPDSNLITNFLEVRGNGSLSETYRYKVRSAPEAAKMELMYFAPVSPTTSGTFRKNIRTCASEQNADIRSNWPYISSEVGQLNTDWRSSEPHIVGKISSQCLEENMTQDEVKREFNRRHTAITSAADVDYIKASPDLEDGIPTWAPRFGSQHLEHMEPDEYQPNIYMGGTPVMLSSKQDQVAKQDGQHSASSTKKKKKRSKRSEKRESKATNEEPQNE
ncbi:protocadherin gamma-C5-like isoform X1 [Heptranchias perlo]|uniref:protocadherin gamma-C5-like isoform X1 n=1 Tax=Heptranchias perlo TaxID=212740 RepID=UPI00355968FF